MRLANLMVLALAVMAPVNAFGQDDDLVGTWQLVSASAVSDRGERNEAPYGANPSGVLTYTSNGRVSALISYGGRKSLSADRVEVDPVSWRPDP
jgi:hypothetical protein